MNPTDFIQNLPGPDLQLDFSRGDWWLALLFYLLREWLNHRHAGRSSK